MALGVFSQRRFRSSRGQWARYSPAIMCSSPPGLTDEEIDVAFQQSGTAADEPAALGPATQVVPVQPPHLMSQPYSKSPTPAPAFTLIGRRALAKSSAPLSQTQQAGELGGELGGVAGGASVFPKECDTPKPSKQTLKSVTKV